MKKTLSYLGFAKKAGNLATGYGTCEIMANRGKLKLIIVAGDTAEGSRKKAEALARRGDIPYRVYGESAELSQITGTGGRHIFGITDPGMAKALITAVDKEKEENVNSDKDREGGV